MSYKLTLPFNPIEVSKDIESQVINGDKRQYNTFRLEPFYGGIATARAAGCNLSCAFCWINSSKDDPNPGTSFYSPKEVYQNLVRVSKRGRLTTIARISGAEPTIGKEHLLSLIELSEREGLFKRFLLETNGILLGLDKDYAIELKRFKEHLIVRVSLKAGTREAFEKKTGAKAEFFELPFQAIRYLEEYEIPFRVCAMSKDPKIMPPEERRELLLRLSYNLKVLISLEEEQADPFGVTIKRLTERGIITNAEELRQEQYAPLDLQRLLDVLEYLRKKDSRWKSKGLSDLIKRSLFQIVPSNCRDCTSKNPWHGHGIEHDLDPRLGSIT